MELQYFPGDRVQNLEPHLSDDQLFLIELNQVGIVKVVTPPDVTVLWPLGIETTVKLAAIMPYQPPVVRQG